jgi:hypothetical protein
MELEEVAERVWQKPGWEMPLKTNTPPQRKKADKAKIEKKNTPQKTAELKPKPRIAGR